MKFDFGYFIKVFPQLLAYIPSTLLMAIVAMIIATILGAIIVTLQFSKVKIIKGFANLYISIFRGIPTLVQLFIVYYGLPQLFPILKGLPALFIAIVGLGIKQSSYLAEIFRAAINSVDHGQVEAGLSLNIKYTQLFTHIILPQATVNALPATGNTFVSLLKETSLAFTLGITELFAQGKMLAGGSFKYFETYAAVGITYWLLIVIYTRLQHLLENYLTRPYRRESHVTDKRSEPVRAVGTEASAETH